MWAILSSTKSQDCCTSDMRHARQSAFWNGWHPHQFCQIYDCWQFRYDWPKFGEKRSTIRQKWTTSMKWTETASDQHLQSEAVAWLSQSVNTPCMCLYRRKTFSVFYEILQHKHTNISSLIVCLLKAERCVICVKKFGVMFCWLLHKVG